MSTDQSAGRPAGTPAGYRERLWPAVWIWLFAALLGLSAGLVALPFSEALAGFAAGLATLLLFAGLVAWTPQVMVDQTMLTAGRARVPVQLTGTTTALTAAQVRHEHGPGLDARAYLCMRGWVSTGLRVDITDPQDPTPYWLISSRDPERLVAALDAARRHTV